MLSSSTLAKRISRTSKDILIIGEPGTGKRTLARSGKGPFIGLDGLSATSGEIGAVLSGKKPMKQAVLCLANVDAFAAHEQDMIAAFLRTHRKNHLGLRVILTASDVSRIAFDVNTFERYEVPPLRKRTDELPDLVRSILQSLGKGALKVNEGVINVLACGSWPGNIRELVNVIGKGASVSDGDELKLPHEFLDEHQHLQDAIENIVAQRSFNLDDMLWFVEKRLIERLLDVTKHHQSMAAQLMQLSEANFRYRLKKFGIKSVREEK